MNDFSRDVRAFILRALLRYKKPLSASTLKMQISAAFPVTFTDSDLSRHISDCQSDELIIGTNDDVFGVVWALTAHGELKARQLG